MDADVRETPDAEDDEDYQPETSDESDQDADEGILAASASELITDQAGEEIENDDEEYEDELGDEDEDDAGDLPTTRTLLSHGFTAEQLRRILNIPPELLNVFGLSRDHQRRRPPISHYDWPPIPNPAGQDLNQSGSFGFHKRKRGPVENTGIARKLMNRELGLESSRLQQDMITSVGQEMLPSTQPEAVINYDHRGYSGQFSDDGEFFFSCVQDAKIRMYDTSNPYRWRYYKTVTNPHAQWTLTDASLSPDNRFLASCSFTPEVCFTSTEAGDNTQWLDFASGVNPSSGRRRMWGRAVFGIFSLRFSDDGREIVAGTNSKEICVHDLETAKTILRIDAHDNDVNAVCYGEKGSPHILYSGSDDATVKIWDRRSLGNNRPAGIFLGHTEGVTYIDSKGDGRYIISNSKDQTMKMWDIRKSISPDVIDESDLCEMTGFDYRQDSYPESQRRPPPRDCSLMTFRGHAVLSTLIRCHFSPIGSNDGRHVYSGSTDGKVYIWNLDGSIKSTIDVQAATCPVPTKRMGRWGTKVRDASWHPSAPIIAATAFNGSDSRYGTVSVHAWNDGLDEDDAEPRMGIKVSARLCPADEDVVDRDMY